MTRRPPFGVPSSSADAQRGSPAVSRQSSEVDGNGTSVQKPLLAQRMQSGYSVHSASDVHAGPRSAATHAATASSARAGARPSASTSLSRSSV
eukprot:CAMPEP_0185709528 /NCGR_PEP_ID=MMETSP1164-20130828/28882_1 /TAXON_ID=1104430 /ORGANISM="Chrysoreinhardia sp, Strain CCMP2950" /LENGTH=92 /DNA_ID=CAMNT_0028377027 /DNA_START=198 /DNA_END=473 /DNA_ORIENTATION=-